MARSWVKAIDLPAGRDDDVSVAGWFAFFGLFLAATAGPLTVLLAGRPWAWTWRAAEIAHQLAGMATAVKLLAFLVYVSLCCTFLPLPTGPMVAAVATEGAAVAGGPWATAMVVGAVGALGSTIANLNDYHLFTWMLRSRRIARVRATALYALSAKWFARSPFWILAIFNIIPIPVDVIRMLATTCRYGRLPFAAANFAGRFVRYAAIAYVTYSLGDRGGVAVLVLLAAAVALGIGRLAAQQVRRLRSGRDANPAGAGVSDQ